MHRLGQSSMRAALIYQHATAKRDQEIDAAMDERLERESEGPDDDDDGAASVPARLG